MRRLFQRQRDVVTLSLVLAMMVTLLTGGINLSIISSSNLSGIVAALIMISRFNSANAGYGASYLLVTVLLGVLGGVNPAGGFGKVSGLVLALVILQIISSGLNLLKVSTFVTLSLWGIILILVMTVNNTGVLIFQREAGILFHRR